MPRTLLRNSERQTFLDCRQKWWWVYQDRLQPKVAGPALRFGTLIHLALEERYPPGTKRGPHPALTFERLYEEELRTAYGYGFRDEDGKWQDAGELGIAMMNGFIEEYGDDEDWEVLASELPFRTRITPDVTMVGKLDGVWKHRSKGHVMLIDWKTTAQFWFKLLPMDEQAGVYWTFAPPYLRKHGYLEPKQPLKGILYTFMRKSMPDERPKNEHGQSLNKDGTVSKRQPEPLFHRQLTYRSRHDRDSIRARVIAQAEEMKEVREGRMAAYKHPSRSNCAGCPFFDPCELHESGADYMPLFRAHFLPYDPYSDHEITEEGRERIIG